MQKKRYFRTTAAVKQTTTTSINVFNKCNSHYNDKFLDTVKLLPNNLGSNLTVFGGGGWGGEWLEQRCLGWKKIEKLTIGERLFGTREYLM